MDGEPQHLISPGWVVGLVLAPRVDEMPDRPLAAVGELAGERRALVGEGRQRHAPAGADGADALIVTD